MYTYMAIYNRSMKTGNKPVAHYSFSTVHTYITHLIDSEYTLAMTKSPSM